MTKGMTAYTKWWIAHPWHVTGTPESGKVPANCDCGCQQTPSPRGPSTGGKTMSTEHTPGPWTPATILHLARAEDVDFAVRACNNYYKLLKALGEVSKALAHISWANFPDDPSTNLCKKAYLAANLAIAEAEKETRRE